MKPRIALVSHDFYPIQGGQGRNFSELYKHLRAEPSEFEFLGFSPRSNDWSAHTTIFSWTNRLPGAQIHFSIFLNCYLKKLIELHRLDLLLLNGGPGGILLPLPAPAPVVYCVNHTYAQQARLVPGQQWKKILIPLERRGYLLSRRLAAISTTTLQSLTADYGFKSEGIEVIPVGINCDRFHPDPGPKIPDSILFVGRLEARKGIDFLLKAFERVSRSLSSAKLFIVGTGSLEAELRRVVQQRQLSAQVTFLGAVPDVELPGWYQRTLLTAVPSMMEGLGISVLEALASGCTVVGTNVVGINSVIAHEREGLLVEYGDVDTLSAALLRGLQSAELRERLGNNGRRTAVANYSWAKVVEKYLALFRGVLGTAV